MSVTIICSISAYLEKFCVLLHALMKNSKEKILNLIIDSNID